MPSDTEPLPSESSRAAPRTSAWVAGLVGFVALGVAFRVVVYLGGRNLWVDEAMLALNIVRRGFAELLQPLDWDQAAPVGFLLATKAATTVLGTTEIGLRFLPFLASVLSLPLFARVAWRLLPSWAAIVAVALYACSSIVVVYSAEFKPYGVDAAITIGLLAAAMALLEGRNEWWRWALLTVLGAGAVWCSFPVAFVLGGLGSALALDALVRRNVPRFLVAAAMSAAWLGSFVVNYFTFAKQVRDSDVMQVGWSPDFMPFPPRSPGDITWLFDHFFGAFAMPGGMGGSDIHAGGLAAAFFLIGLVVLAKERWPLAWTIAVPWLLALAASALGAYPFVGRFLLYMVPLMALGVAYGAWIVLRATAREYRVAAAVITAVLLGGPMLEAYQLARSPLHREQVAPVLGFLRAHFESGDVIYVFPYSLPAFDYYTREQAFPAGAVVRGEAPDNDDLETYRRQLLRLSGHRRIWVLLSHSREDGPVLEAYARAIGDTRSAFEAPGARVWLVVPRGASSE